MSEIKLDLFIFEKKKDAELVLGYMRKIIGNYDCVTYQDARELVGLECTYEDSKIGWGTLDQAQIRKTDEGYLLDLPEPKSIM